MTRQDYRACKTRARILLATWGFVSYTAGVFTFMYVWCSSSEMHRQQLVNLVTFGLMPAEHVQH
jgi:hypothetical protein